MSHRTMTRIALGALLLATGGVAASTATAHAAEAGASTVEPAAAGPFTRLVGPVADDVSAERAVASLKDGVKEHVPGEVSGGVSVHTPLSRL
ncbi:hypothetical protein I5Q34_31415 [Streptomyces sp. AV19]|uniref:hypothetical protein n=1 Tax=Streptomyces sp. AV19 TaxID=2793068 RepID=UPI0018FE4C47|nr:hypothetical protein [Streptomyces sp. AV19]MBH1938719.1 hypothetical protein [Streptomyces sp. AV19]MDG4533980.1 hypothetical protein [Streptomyces sp. AV19]